VTGKVVTRKFEIAMAEEPGIGPPEQGRAHPPTEQEPHLVAGHRGHRAADQEDDQVEVPPGCEQAGGEEQGVSR